MNIIDAIQSGYPFNRPRKQGYYLYAYNRMNFMVNLHAFTQPKVIESHAGRAVNLQWFTIDDVIAEDWEIFTKTFSDTPIPNYSATNTPEG